MSVLLPFFFSFVVLRKCRARHIKLTVLMISSKSEVNKWSQSHYLNMHKKMMVDGCLNALLLFAGLDARPGRISGEESAWS